MIWKKIQELEINIKKYLYGDFFGVYKTAFKGQGIDFTELKEYSFWDPIKNIDWNASAKHKRLFTKLYEQERDLNVLFLLDIWASMHFWTKEKTKLKLLEEIFFLLAMCAQHTNDSIWSLLFFDKEYIFFDFKKWEENIVKTIKTIHKKQATTFWDLNQAIKYTQKLKIKESLIFIITDDIEQHKWPLHTLQANNEIIYINIFDPYENTWSDYFSLSLWGNKKSLHDFFIWWKQKRRFEQQRKNKIKTLEKTLRKNRIDYLNLNTQSDIFGAFYKLFYMRWNN